MTIEHWTGAVRRRRRGLFVPVGDRLRRVTRVLLWDGSKLRGVYNYPGSDASSALQTVSTDGPATAFKSMLAGNFNFDANLASGDYANYLASITRRMVGRAKWYRESWSNAINVGANPSPPAYLTACSADLAAADPEISLILETYPGLAAGLPGTWQYTPQFQLDGVTTNATWTTAQTTLATWAGYNMAQTESNCATFLQNVQWAIAKKLEKTGCRIVVGQNEKSNPYIGSGIGENNVSGTAMLATTRGIPAYECIIRDFPLTLRYTQNAITLALKRWTVVNKAIYELKRKIGLSGDIATLRDSIDWDWYYADGVLPEQTFYRTYTGGYVWDPAGSGFPWAYSDWNATFNGAWQSYIDLLAYNKHRDDSKNTKFDGTELTDPAVQATDANLSGNVWQAQAIAAAANGGSMVPTIVTEAGTYFGTISRTTTQASSDGATNGTWGVETGAAGVEIYPAVTNSRGTICSLTVGRDALSMYRSGWYWVGKMWYGTPICVHYSTAFSLSNGNNHWDSRTGTESLWAHADGGDGLRFKPFPFWQAHLRHTDPQNFDAREWDPAFPTKDWTQFHDLATWAAFINMTKAPTGTPLTQTPYLPWNEYTFGGTAGAGVLEMGPWTATDYPGHQTTTNDRMIVAKPVWLPFPDKTYRIEVDACFQNAAATATAQGKLEVRGYDKTNGLARQFDVLSGGTTSAGGGTGSNNWKRLAVEFQHVGHGLIGAPSANYALITLQFNNAGTWPLQFRDCTIAW